MDKETVKTNITSADHWMRFVYMLLFAVILYVAGIVVGVVVLIQFLFALFTGSDNTQLRQLGDSLSQYIHAALRFLTYNSDDKPFPFADWPEAAPIAEPAVQEAAPAQNPEPASEASASEAKAASETTREPVAEDTDPSLNPNKKP
ncbi:DUF4389 domain-containing protein [Gilvimarinus xylanilyticus]|uniref:DUF4389 domain-containing protein n=1 Tax=Gilvimarinus xylanilyticus TaxID=2944139 RepID=A0A9X2HUX0_9GAMM|nr:DUF4389 domain-containing protein [Gilvimarinus xylanilyticus]MCP8898878.1 DUF4389 domain-containing protein [Gilvimarinus xylanilyticus]